MQGDFNLSYFADGILPAAFMIGLMGTSALLTSLTAHFNAFRLIGDHIPQKLHLCRVHP